MIHTTINPFLMPQSVSVVFKQFFDYPRVVEGASTQIEIYSRLHQFTDMFFTLAFVIFDKVHWIASSFAYLPGFDYQISK